MSTAIVAFLTARFDELFKDAPGIHDGDCDNAIALGYDSCNCSVPKYLRADIAAKRKIVAEHDPGRYYRRERERTPRCPVCLSDREGRYPEDWDADAAPCRTLRLLAAPFRAHPDFDPAWAVE